MRRVLLKISVYAALALGWAAVLHLIIVVPRYKPLWEKAESGPSLLQRSLVASSEWLQDGFHLIWVFWTVAALTFVWFYLQFGRPRGLDEESPATPSPASGNEIAEEETQ